MYETLVALIAAHLLSDFALQSDWMVANKEKARVFLLHILIVGLSAAAFIGARDHYAATAVGAIVLTHFAIDYAKMRLGDSLLTFLADQVAHVVVVLGVSLVRPTLAADGAWGLLSGDVQSHYYALLVYGSGLITAVPLGGILIKKMIRPFIPPSTDGAQTGAGGGAAGAGDRRKQAPPNAGRYIGWLERALTFAFMLAKQPEGVGFLLAAKSVLRIGDLKDEHDRSHAEYIIIGTFLSFGWGLVIAMITIAAAQHWTAPG
jgi:hypothetical protein